MKKTPLFDEKIKDILDKAQPGEKICQESGESFEISMEDIDFYKKMLVPLPTISTQERLRRLLAHSPPPDEFFKIKSTLSGKEIITNISPEPKIPVYSEDEWWSDEWNALDYGISYDSSKSFFEQFHALRLLVPHPAKLRGAGNVNSPWAIGGANLKDCYMVSSGSDSENILYSASIFQSHDSMELLFSDHCELGYQLFNCKYCYNSAVLDDCENCINCYFDFDLKNCESCFGCVNLRHKKYYFFNQPLTQAEYEEKIKNINLGSRKEFNHWLEKFTEFKQQNAFQKDLNFQNTENVMGDNLIECKNCQDCFDTYKTQNSSNIFRSLNVRDSYDIIGSLNIELCIGLCAKDTYNGKFCTEGIFDSANVEYCELCYNIENCFGCYGLRNKKFCILNHQYSENEYWQMVDKIKCAMLDRGEYGQILPLEYLIYPYNLTWANILFPLTFEKAKSKGLSWHINQSNTSNDTMRAEALPDDIKDAQSDIIGEKYSCSQTNKLFTIIKQEYEFYKKMNLPLPTVHPIIHRQNLYKKIKAPKLVISKCASCNKEIPVRSSKEAVPVKYLCKECYFEKINN